MVELDVIDRRIVAALQAEGRLPIVDLADRVGLSATPCQRRVRRLEEAGVIARYAALVPPAALGLGLRALVQVTLDDHSEAVVAAFEAEIRARPEVVACYAVTGDMDFLLHVQAADLAAFSDFAMKALLRMPGVRGTRSSFIMQEVKGDLAWAPEAAPQPSPSTRR
jgi:Lrp/AsnC family leucine-responsive transcriptional regulator